MWRDLLMWRYLLIRVVSTPDKPLTSQTLVFTGKIYGPGAPDMVQQGLVGKQILCQPSFMG